MRWWSIATAQNLPLTLPYSWTLLGSWHSASAFTLLCSPTAMESALASHCGWLRCLFKKTKRDTFLFVPSPHQQECSIKNKAKWGKAYILVTWVIYSPKERKNDPWLEVSVFIRNDDSQSWCFFIMCIINVSLWKLPMTLITSGCSYNICVDLNAWWSFSLFWDSKQKFVNNARLNTKNNKETATHPVSSREKSTEYKVK